MIGRRLSWIDQIANEKKSFLSPQIHKVTNGLRRLEERLFESDNVALARLYLKARSAERRLIEGEMTLITIDEAVLWTYEWIKRFTSRYDLIVGIPRAGLLIGNVIACRLGIPLTTPDMFSDGRFWSGRMLKQNQVFSDILIVDETFRTGESMERASEIVSRLAPDAKITRAALIFVGSRTAERQTEGLVDTYFRSVLPPYFFEWELMDEKPTDVIGMDLDGVICEECPSGSDDDELKYLNWLRNARSYLVPHYEVDFIVSNRLERYRTETEEWLRKQGIRYRELRLWDLESKNERNGRWTENKIEVLMAAKPDLFLESDDSQAMAIWSATKIPTICTDKMILYS